MHLLYVFVYLNLHLSKASEWSRGCGDQNVDTIWKRVQDDMSLKGEVKDPCVHEVIVGRNNRVDLSV